jgi:hypothetical protein
MDEELVFNSTDDHLTELGQHAIEDLLAENWNSEESKVWDFL